MVILELAALVVVKLTAMALAMMAWVDLIPLKPVVAAGEHYNYGDAAGGQSKYGMTRQNLIAAPGR